MKITFYATGFLNKPEYVSGMDLFLQQYEEKFPGLQYLHLELEQFVETTKDKDRYQSLYSQDEKGLKIRIAKCCKTRLTPFELFNDLRTIFDNAVEEHLKNHQHIFSVSDYL